MPNPNLCKNCNTELSGLFCSDCGQKDTELLSVKAIVRELTDNVFSFDSRFFITLKYLITKPGFLTIEYWGGRRTKYLPPIRLYLVISILYFFIAPTFDETGSVDIPFKQDIDEGDGIRFDETDPIILHFFANIMNQGLRIIIEQQLSWNDLILDNFQRVMFLLMPFMGLIIFFLYKNNKHLYSYHLITVLHFHCFLYFIFTITALLPFFDFFTPFFLIYYSFMMLHKVYNESWIKTTFKFSILSFIYGLTVLCTQIGLLVGKIFLIGINT